jgi:hypothetical protein
MRHDGPPIHLITVPQHNPLKTGTLLGILSDVARPRSLVIEALFVLI